MKNLTNYIKNGKGSGLLFLLAAAVLMTIFLMPVLKQTYAQMRPQFTKIADEFLPIEVKNEQIINTSNTYKRIDIQLGEHDGKEEIFPIVLDTQSETTTVPKAERGIFIMRDIIYLITQDEVRRIPLKDGEFNKTLFEEKVDTFLSLFSLMISMILVCIFFLFSLIKTLILALLSRLLLKMKQSADLWSFDVLMRLAALVIATIEVICFALNLLGLPIMWFYQFLIGLALVGIFINKEINQPKSND